MPTTNSTGWIILDCTQEKRVLIQADGDPGCRSTSRMRSFIVVQTYGRPYLKTSHCSDSPASCNRVSYNCILILILIIIIIEIKYFMKKKKCNASQWFTSERILNLCRTPRSYGKKKIYSSLWLNIINRYDYIFCEKRMRFFQSKEVHHNLRTVVYFITKFILNAVFMEKKWKILDESTFKFQYFFRFNEFE